MKTMNTEIKKVVDKVKNAQNQFQTFIKNQNWMEEAKKYAERQGKEVKKLFGPDVEKLKGFIEREKKELERFQRQIPGEVKKIRKFLDDQKKDIGKLLINVRKMSATQAGKTSKMSEKSPIKVKVKKSTASTTTNKEGKESKLSGTPTAKKKPSVSSETTQSL